MIDKHHPDYSERILREHGLHEIAERFSPFVMTSEQLSFWNAISHNQQMVDIEKELATRPDYEKAIKLYGWTGDKTNTRSCRLKLPVREIDPLIKNDGRGCSECVLSEVTKSVTKWENHSAAGLRGGEHETLRCVVNELSCLLMSIRGGFTNPYTKGVKKTNRLPMKRLRQIVSTHPLLRYGVAFDIALNWLISNERIEISFKNDDSFVELHCLGDCVELLPAPQDYIPKE